MVKNVLIGLLLTLLVIAGFLIVRNGLSRGEEQSTEGATETVRNLSEQETTDPEEEDLEEAEAYSLLVGTWRSLDDPQSTLVFHSNGEITDSYGGGVLNETGNYQLFKESANLPIGTSKRPSGMVLRQTFGSQDYYYHILELDLSSLELVFLSGSGSTLRYERLSY